MDCAYLILRFVTTGPETTQRRFRSVTASQACEGYSTGGWFRAVMAAAFFLDRRNGKKFLDRPSGQFALVKLA